MTIGKDVCLNDHQLSDCTLGWKRTAVNFGSNSFYNNPYPPFRWEHLFLLSRFKTKAAAPSSFEKGSSEECADSACFGELRGPRTYTARDETMKPHNRLDAYARNGIVPEDLKVEHPARNVSGPSYLLVRWTALHFRDFVRRTAWNLRFPELLITVGILVAYLTDYLFARGEHWRWMFIVAYALVPETKGRTLEEIGDLLHHRNRYPDLSTQR